MGKHREPIRNTPGCGCFSWDLRIQREAPAAAGGLSSEARRAGSKSSGVAVSKTVDDLAQEFLQVLTWNHLEPLDCVTENICSTHTVRVHG